MELKKARSTMIQKTSKHESSDRTSIHESIHFNVRLEDGLGPILQFMDDLPPIGH